MTVTSADPTGQRLAGEGHAVAFWEPRRVLTLEAARRHSSIIRIARFVLIGFAGFLILLLLWFFVKAPKSIVSVDNPNETVKMIRPVYKGRTADNLPYRITADVAVRFIQNPDETRLVNPVLNFLRTNGAEESIVLAANGLYNAETQILELHNDVNLQTDDGTDCKTTHARIFVKVKRIEGDEPIDCTGGFGRAGGNAYEINENYTVLVFKQGMTAHIIPEKTPKLRGAQQ